MRGRDALFSQLGVTTGRSDRPRYQSVIVLWYCLLPERSLVFWSCWREANVRRNQEKRRNPRA
jgi:hypothetical protein